MTIQNKTFKEFPEAIDVINTLIDRMESKIQAIEESRKISLQYWNDVRFAQYYRDIFNFKIELEKYHELKKEIELHEIRNDVGRELSGMMDTESSF